MAMDLLDNERGRYRGTFANEGASSFSSSATSLSEGEVFQAVTTKRPVSIGGGRTYLRKSG
jgi:hypothetical protein